MNWAVDAVTPSLTTTVRSRHAAPRRTYHSMPRCGAIGLGRTCGIVSHTAAHFRVEAGDDWRWPRLSD
eukprot:746764-Hanusia_phi.AAC.1